MGNRHKFTGKKVTEEILSDNRYGMEQDGIGRAVRYGVAVLISGIYFRVGEVENCSAQYLQTLLFRNVRC